MRKALIVGIDYYEHIITLNGCVNDAYSVKAALERNADGTVNFVSPRLLAGTGPSQAVSRSELRESIQELFNGDSDIALLYFAGHGFIDNAGGFICASDSRSGDDGLSLHDVLVFANRSAAKNRVIILDSCHSGITGNSALAPGTADLTEGTTILTASTEEQYALESGGSGVFTGLFVDALNGAAANLRGSVTPGSAYAHIDQSLGPWQQRPVFKTNVKTFVSLREADPPIELADLQALTRVFGRPELELPLDPSFEPERNGTEPEGTPEPDPVNTATFRILQNYVRVNLVRPVDAPHMWHAAMESKACELTVLGQHYWKLVHEGLI